MARRCIPRVYARLLLFVPQLLYRVTNGSSNQRAFERLLAIDGRSSDGADDRAARSAVMVAMTVMFRRRECTFSRHHQSQREYRCLNSGRGFRSHLWSTSGRENCEIDAATSRP
jgi:hypothetical protein